MESINLQEVLDALNMAEFLDSEAVDYKETHGSSGRQLNIRECPVCGTAKWKVFMNKETGLGNCFSGSCQARFTKWSFIRSLLNLDNSGTFRVITTYVNGAGFIPARRIVLPEKKSLLELPESITLPYYSKNIRYLAERGITTAMAKHFELRYCEEGFFYYERDGMPRAMPFHRRVIIPIHNLDGDLVSFQGRDVTGDAERKYMFPPGFASTGKYLYNGHRCKGLSEIVVGEGVFDCFSLHKAFYEQGIGSIATFGMHLSESVSDTNDQIGEFIKLKHEGLRKVTFFWDSERAAIQKAVKAALTLRKYGLKTQIALLPEGLDPNEASLRDTLYAYETAKEVTPLAASNLLMTML